MNIILDSGRWGLDSTVQYSTKQARTSTHHRRRYMSALEASIGLEKTFSWSRVRAVYLD